MEVGTILRRIRREKLLTLQEVCDHTGNAVLPGQLSRIEKEGMKTAGENLYKIARALGVSLDAVFHEAVTGERIDGSLHTLPQIPIIDWALAGKFNPETHQAISYLTPPYPMKVGSYALIVEGESMLASMGESFPEGSIILMELDQPKNKSMVIVRNGGDKPVFRQLITDSSGDFLKPLNTQYPLTSLSPEAVFCGTVRFCIQITK